MLHLQCRYTGTIPLEAETISPDQLVGKSLAEMEKLPVQHGNRQGCLADYFSIRGDASDGAIAVEGDCQRVKLIGANMTLGRILVDGPVGMHVGAEMRGGELEVRGSAGDWAGAEMRGGVLRVRGDVGHLAGAGYRGSRYGMRGGVLLIDGAAGNEVGAVMRRGFIAVGGTVGDFLGVSMIAGTVVARGPIGQRPGAGMKRGSLILLSENPALLPTFRESGMVRPLILSLCFAYLRDLGWEAPRDMESKVWRRHWGDLVSLGKGEVFSPVGSSR